ncbi:MotA/TolQ/ExbB proton channel family protein [Methylosinus sp. H3A]|uniref:MotA/TolQ/ExbB proton channel family protein n=1 Tax=Methylosinus sp. H3A TaxID=2785786 RepID=UPI0018C2B183|nr:MotA/TolQ/ExbB proton channel family protein [Methylosinus sp. H3A]MBG0812473.1 MotA/TolQ/ExbB proton channel family protein [Methylosinus sp. H3A]
MQIDHAFFHEICIDILYGCLALLAFVLIERLVYYALLALRSRRISAAIKAHALGTSTTPKPFGPDELSRSFAEYVAAQNEPGCTRARVEDLSSALFIRVDAKVSARLWMLDTIVTAAPLLGLLGTILGIMDTFNALSSGGVSDPAAVSRGIAAALVATAVGIGTALIGLIAHNLLHRQADVIIDGFKCALLAATRDRLPAAAE